MVQLELQRYAFMCSTDSRAGSRRLLSHPRDMVYERTTAIIGMCADHEHRRDMRVVVRFQHPAIYIQLKSIMDARAIVKM